jgi:RsmE family RNA methyltransferase
MNCILLSPEDFITDSRVRLSDRRFTHITSVLRAAPGSIQRVGLIGGRMGAARIETITPRWVEMRVRLDRDPPAPLPATVILALPRPKTFKKAVHIVCSTGIKTLYVIGSWRVEKSYWQSPALHDTSLEALARLGLEQACDTIMPAIHFRRLFKPFVEDELPAIIERAPALLASPNAPLPCPHRIDSPATVIIGPEGGFNEYECKALRQAGAREVSLGSRVLRVEVALPLMLGKLFS